MNVWNNLLNYKKGILYPLGLLLTIMITFLLDFLKINLDYSLFQESSSWNSNKGENAKVTMSWDVLHKATFFQVQKPIHL